MCSWLRPRKDWQSTKWLTLDCRDGVHGGCTDCDCWCHDDEWEDE